MPSTSAECLKEKQRNYFRPKLVGLDDDIDAWIQEKAGVEKIKQIGNGSFGKAFLVQHLETKRLLVLKVVDISAMRVKEQKAAMNEVRILASLDHPFIVRYRGSFLAPNLHLCILMDYAAGGDLSRLIAAARRQHRRFSERQLLLWFAQASLALRYLHQKHILHRDLKSQNVFLTRKGSVCLGDFGIAKRLDATGSFAGTQIGTPYFFSPEICAGEPYSWSADIWALGCLIHEAAALSVPFAAENIGALLEKIGHGSPPSLPAAYSPELRQLVRSCLQRDSRNRPSAAELLRHPLIHSAVSQMLLEERARRAVVKVPLLTLPGSSDCENSTAPGTQEVDLHARKAFESSDRQPGGDLGEPPQGEELGMPQRLANHISQK